jgi:metallo-beta-lactamase family protein
LHYTETHEESQAINNVPGPKIVIAGSGMIAGGRVIHHVRKYLSNSKNTILLAGYQAVGTYGRLLAEGKKHIIFYGEPFDVNANIVQISGYSAHRDKEGLLEFVGKIKNNCKSLNLILGDNESLVEFRQAVYDRFGVHAHICLKKEILEF